MSHNPIDVHVGKMMRLRRRELRMSQTELGEALGVTFQQVQKQEKGANRVSASALFKISQTLGVSPVYFFPPLDGSDGADTSLVSAAISVPNIRDLGKLSGDDCRLVGQLIGRLTEASE